jgi:hypothetical protein
MVRIAAVVCFVLAAFAAAGVIGLPWAAFLCAGLALFAAA